MRKRSFRTLAISILLVVLSCFPMGCATMRSTMYTHDGCQTCSNVKKHLKGVPTTLDVPTHLQISVIRTRFADMDIAAGRGEVNFVENLETREVSVDPKTQKEIFTVDFKRPAAGTLDYKLTIDPKQQYFKNIENTSTDQTIEKVTGLVAAILKTIPPVRAVREAPTGDAKLFKFQDVVASEVFALNEPNLQERIQEFLNTYVNNCHQHCMTDPCPPGPGPGCGPKCRVLPTVHHGR